MMQEDDDGQLTPTTPTDILQIGDDVLIYILEFLSPVEICNTSLICEHFHQLSSNDRTWFTIVTSNVVCIGDSGELLTPRLPYKEWYQERLQYCRADMIDFIKREENFKFSDINMQTIKIMYRMCKKGMISSTDSRNNQFSQTHASFFNMASQFAQRNKLLLSIAGCGIRGILEINRYFLGRLFPHLTTFTFLPRRTPSVVNVLLHNHRIIALIICVSALGRPSSWAAVQTGGRFLSTSTFYYLSGVLLWETGLYSSLAEYDVTAYQGLNSPWRRRFAVAFTAFQILLACRDITKKRLSSASLMCAPLVASLMFNSWLFKYHLPLANKFSKFATLGAVDDLEKFIPDERTRMATSRLILPFYNKHGIIFRLFAYFGTIIINPYGHFKHASHYKWALLGSLLNILIRINTSTVTAIYGNFSGFWFHLFAHLLQAIVPLVTPSDSFEELYRKKAT